MATKNGALAAFVESPRHINFETQTRDEELILLLRRHWVTNIPWVVLTLVMVLVPIVFLPLVSRDPELLAAIPDRFRLVGILLWYLLTLGFAFESFVLWYFNVFLITDRRVIDIDFWGLLHKSVTETPLANIQDVTHEVGGFWRVVFNFGHVYVQTAAEVPRLEFWDVPHPEKVHRKITELMQKTPRRPV
jgi:membrane protein YdbS with pleckstrin-like domain